MNRGRRYEIRVKSPNSSCCLIINRKKNEKELIGDLIII
jgi:hypothetical protein